MQEKVSARPSDAAFNSAKKVSDFVAFLSRAAFLSILSGLSWAAMTAGKGVFNSAFALIAWLFCLALTMLLAFWVYRFLDKRFDEISFPIREHRSRWHRITKYLLVAFSFMGIIMGWQQTQLLAQRFGRQQLDRLEQTKGENGVAKELLMPPTPKFR